MFIRDILIDGTQLIYCKLFRSVDLPMRHAAANSQVISMTPRYAVESLSMVLVAAIALSFSLRSKLAAVCLMLSI